LVVSNYPPGVLRLEPGLRLDRYELLCVLARGGMGSVWLARFEGKHGFERLVALKTVLPQHQLDERFRKMFLDEAQLASRITHPNVAQTLDLGEQQGALYFVMEWVDGDSLRKLRSTVKKKGEEFPLPLALRIVSDACAGLHAAHELRDANGELLNVVHRDISPHNVLVSISGVTKIIDFGIAKAKERVAEETNTDELKGKVDYMAPEQAVGRGIDRRADIWSLGAVLYYLCSGNPPYDADTKVASLMARIEGKPPTPLPPSVPQSVRAIITKAMAREPEKRFATCCEMQKAVDEAMVHVGSATTTELAAYVRSHLAESEQTRKRAVQVALDAAAERQKRNIPLERPIESVRSSSSSVESSEVSLKAPRVPAEQPASLHNPLNAPSESGASPMPVVSDKPLTAPPAGEESIPGVPKKRSGKTIGIVAVFAAVTLVAVLGFAFTRGGPNANTGSGAGTTPTTTVSTKGTTTLTLSSTPTAATTTARSSATADPSPTGTWPDATNNPDTIDLDAVKDAAPASTSTSTSPAGTNTGGAVVRPIGTVRPQPPKKDAGAGAAPQQKCPNGGVWPRCNDGF
jgi:serine/threonine-protein kinase